MRFSCLVVNFWKWAKWWKWARSELDSPSSCWLVWPLLSIANQRVKQWLKNLWNAPTVPVNDRPPCYTLWLKLAYSAKLDRNVFYAWLPAFIVIRCLQWLLSQVLHFFWSYSVSTAACAFYYISLSFLRPTVAFLHVFVLRTELYELLSPKASSLQGI